VNGRLRATVSRDSSGRLEITPKRSIECTIERPVAVI